MVNMVAATQSEVDAFKSKFMSEFDDTGVSANSDIIFLHTEGVPVGWVDAIVNGMATIYVNDVRELNGVYFANYLDALEGKGPDEDGTVDNIFVRFPVGDEAKALGGITEDGQRTIIIDHQFNPGWLNVEAEVQSIPFVRTLAHELHHTQEDSEGFRDPTRDLSNGVVGDPYGYLGGTPTVMNEFFLSFDGDQRNSYSAAGTVDSLNSLVDSLEGLTGTFDNVLTTQSSSYRSDGSIRIGAPGMDVSMRPNTSSEGVKDLIIGIAMDLDSSQVGGAEDIYGNGKIYENTIRGGQGDDWIYGGKGIDVLLGDQGADFIHGGSQGEIGGLEFDSVIYWNHERISQYGIEQHYNSGIVIVVDAPTESESNEKQVIDGGGDTDTLIDIELVRASQENDELVFSGDVGLHLSQNLEAPYNFYLGGFQDGAGDFLNLSGLTGSGVVIYAFNDAAIDDAYFPNASVSTGSSTASIDGNIEWSRLDFSEEPDNTNIRLLHGWENFSLTDNDDKFEGGTQPVTVYGNKGEDDITGSSVVEGNSSPKAGAADEIHGGLGADTIDGGSGADVIYDNGNTRPIEEGEDQKEYDELTEAYDADGNDIVFGGAGADVLFHSGGIDTFEGGAGDDRYEFSEDLKPTDELTLRFAETASDSETFFGHDLLQNGGKGVDAIILALDEGVEVSYSYSYEIVEETSTVWDYNGIFWFDDPNPYTVTQFVTVGTYEIVVEGSGSSITIDNVAGRYFEFEGGDPLLSPAFFPLIEMNFVIYNEVNGTIDGGIGDWTYLATDANGMGTGTSTDAFAQGTLTDTGYNALIAHEVERAISDALQAGSEQDDDMFGTNGANNLSGGGGSDRLRGGAGRDLLTGGLGADSLDGGSGTDTASYGDAATGVVASLASPIGLNTGEAAGDTYTDIENLSGSAYSDDLRGSDGANTLFGGDGDDTFWGNSSRDTAIGDVFYGGDGNDVFNPRNYDTTGPQENVVGGWGNDTFDGGLGDDLIRTGSGDDFVQGGGGNDIILVEQSALPFDLSFSSTPGNNSLDGGDGTDRVEFVYFGTNTSFVVDLVAGRTDNSTTGETNYLANIENVFVKAANGGNTTVFGDDGANEITTDGGDDVIYGGAGDDILDAGNGNDSVYGGSGQGDRVKFGAAYDPDAFEQVDGGVVGMFATNNTVFIARDNEFVDFYVDGQFVESRTYAQIATASQTEFDVLNDFFRVVEGSDSTISFEENDLPLNGEVLTIVEINGAAVSPGDSVRLDSGATISLDQNGVMVFDQAGAFADLGIGETAQVEFTYTSQNALSQNKTASALIVIDGEVPSGGSLENDGNLIFLDTTLDNPFNPGEPYIQIRPVSNFDIFKSLVLIDQTSVDPTDVATLDPAGASTFYVFENANGDTFVTDRATDSAVVLQDISLEAWQWAFSQNVPSVQGNAEDNFLLGTENADTIDGDAGNDTLIGRDGNDVLIDGVGDDVVIGEAGDDVFKIGDGNNTFLGGAGADIFDGQIVDSPGAFDGANTFDGGVGIDLLRLSHFAPTNGATINLEEGLLDWYGARANDMLRNIENVGGTRGDDLIIGNDEDNTLSGSTGSDTLEGRGGSDLLVDSQDHDDWLYGGDGDDTFLPATGGIDAFYGGLGSDTIDLSSFAVTFASVDLASGLFGSLGDVLVSIENVRGASGGNSLFGDGQANTLDGYLGNDTLNGREGDDRLIGGAGNDSLEGGGGFDIAVLSGSVADAIIVDLGASVRIETAFNGTDTISKDVELYEFDDDTYTLLELSTDRTLSGTNGADRIDGAYEDADFDVVNDYGQLIVAGGGSDRIYDGAGNDTIFGGDGSDRVYAGAGADHFDGGAATNDWVYYSSSSAGVIVDMNSPDVRATGIEAGDTFTNVERLTGSDFDDIILMGGSANQVFGGAGNDTIRDNSGRDYLWGGDGSDTYSFVAGDGQRDEVRGFQAEDMIDVSGWGVISIDELRFIVTSTGHIEVRTLDASEKILLRDASNVVLDHTNFVLTPSSLGGETVTGSNSADVIDMSFVGDPENDLVNGGGQVIEGLGGNDTISAGSGNDQLYGGDGADRFIGSYGADAHYGGSDNRDEVNYYLSSQGLTIDMTDTSRSTGLAKGDTFVSIERIRGTNYDDTIIVTDGAAIYDARNGDDMLFDGAGANYMRGGNGADTFTLVSGDNALDRINDFDRTEGDLINLEAWGLIGFNDLDIEARTNGQGVPNGGLIVSYGQDSFRLDGFNGVDIPNFVATDFIFLDPSAAATVSGTSGNDVINVSYTGDPDGDIVNDTGQVIEGLAGNDSITGGAGDDTIYGGEGQDRFYDSLGADQYDGGAHQFDEVNYQYGTEGLTIDMVNPTNNTGMAAGDTYVNIERVKGTNYSDIIVASDGVAIFDARGGDDDLTDGTGATFMKGGAGADTFRFILGDGAVERIQDFSITAGDKVDLTNWNVAQFGDLIFTNHLAVDGMINGLTVSHNGESFWMDNYDTTNEASFTISQLEI